VSFEELRYRSYPSFTASWSRRAPGCPYLTVPGKTEVRVRLSGLVVSGSQTEDVGDGLVKEVRLEPAGPDGVLKIVLGGPGRRSEDGIASGSLSGLVVDVYRPKEGAATRGPLSCQGSVPPLKLIVLDAGQWRSRPGAIGPGGVLGKTYGST